jgi:hypothetical protein
MPKILFIDESGDHSLTKIDPQYPIFVLCGVILESESHDILTGRLDDFKLRLFGTRDIVLHTADFTRTATGFERMAEHDFRLTFFRELELLVARTNFQIVACVIFECGASGGTIIAEARDATLKSRSRTCFSGLEDTWNALRACKPG